MELINPEYREKVMTELRSIEARENVKILFAIESGSRAWGFPSPDSDYDARFIYVRHPDWYLSITPGRDVIEVPIDDLLDINGWDIQKALGLLLKPNPVMLEWLNSPIQYIWNDNLCDDLKSFSEEISHAAACIYHYRSLGSRQRDIYITGKEKIKLKKLFYILRPAMAIRWTRHHPETFPPVSFSTLCQGCDLDPNIQGRIDKLMARKSQTKEMGLSDHWPIIEAFIDEELKWAEDHAKDFQSAAKDKLPAANELFRKIVKTAWS